MTVTAAGRITTVQVRVELRSGSSRRTSSRRPGRSARSRHCCA